MTKISIFRGLLNRARMDAPVPADQLEQDRDSAATELAAAEAGAIEAEAAYKAGLLGATDEGLRALDNARRDAAIRIDRARVLVARFAAQAIAADDARAKAKLALTVETAMSAQRAFRETVERELPTMAAMARTILALRSEAERTTALANRALAEAGESGPLPHIEAFRGLPGRPREELRREFIDLWCDDAGNAAGYQDKIVTRSDGSGSLMLPSAHHVRVYTKKRQFELIEFLPAEPHVTPAALDTSLNVPEPYAVPRGNDRSPETQMRALGPARDVARTSSSRLDRVAMGYPS